MRLLVAEDERDLNRLIRKTLEKEGYGDLLPLVTDAAGEQ